MIAKFPGACSRCGHGIKKGEEIDYDSESRKAYHPHCQDSGAENAEDLADRLGFVAHEVAMGTDRLLLLMLTARGGVTTGRISESSHPQPSTEWEMSTGIERRTSGE